MRTETRKAALDYCMADLTRESCGLVVISKGREFFLPCRNISEIHDQFEIHPEDWARAETSGDITRIIHSHVYVPPKPSECDKVSCEGTRIPWSIVSIPTGEWFDFEPTNYKAPLVGREWSHGVLDCYSIIKDYYEELGIILPHFDRDYEWWLKGKNLYVDNFKNAGFKEIPINEVRKHDILLLQIGSSVPNHGAVYIGDDLILHHLHRRLSCRDIFGGYYKKHTVKALRYEKD